jgi:hypothetical protein
MRGIASATSGESNPGVLKETVRVPYLNKFCSVRPGYVSRQWKTKSNVTIAHSSQLTKKFFLRHTLTHHKKFFGVIKSTVL